jgi:hypothetical protein
MKRWVLGNQKENQNFVGAIGRGGGLLVCLLLGASCSKQSVDVDLSQGADDAPRESELVEEANGLLLEAAASTTIRESNLDPRAA